MTMLNRRHFLGLAGAAALGCSRSVRDGDAGTAPARLPAAQPATHRDGATCTPTAANIEGPFFKPDAPRRAVLAAAGDPGRPLVVEGRLLDGACRPLPGATIEVWHADHRGGYDLDGFGHRGHLVTGDDGSYRFDSIVPGRYLNGRQYRPAHIHLKIHARGHESLTTQLYFEGDPYNDVDPFLEPSLIMKWSERGGVIRARYDLTLG
jgi:protocatechuate 3,4-dioxygenase beta subunit